MYFVPMGLLLKAEPAVVAGASATAADLAPLDLWGFARNLAAVTTGNIFGGGFMVAAVYWFTYLRHRERPRRGVALRPVELLFAPSEVERSQQQD